MATRLTRRAARRSRPGRWASCCACAPLSAMPHEKIRLDPERERQTEGRVWQVWGPYLSERQWGTVREDYSAHGNAWEYFPHDHARSRAYRWGEDGIAGFC